MSQSSLNMFSNQSTNSRLSGKTVTQLNQSQPASMARTLPITCQICLGKVKDPCVCPNLHAFCSGCIEIWLEKGKMCPTCRVPISKEQPCRRILGGVENLDDADLMKPSDFSHSSIRKARFTHVFQSYEDEISRLLKYIDSLNIEVTKLKENSKYRSSPNKLNDQGQGELVHALRSKLQQSQQSLNEITIERDNLKEINKKLDSENSILMQDTARLKMIINEKNSQMSNKYTMAAMETKLESYEKEVKQLQKALEKSDRYINELEGKTNQNQKENHNNGNSNYNSESFLANNQKSVKFSEKLETAHNPCSVPKSPPNQAINKQISITKDNFYGSPSKKSPCKTPNKNAISAAPAKISSFSDRMKFGGQQKDLFSSDDTTSQNSMRTQHQQHGQSSQSILLADSVLAPQPSNANSFLFSPMKRLRLDEVHLERPDEMTTTQLNSTASSTHTQDSLTTPPKMVNKSPPRQMKQPQVDDEFNDCLKLLNQAEQKVQNRISPVEQQPLADKYFQSAGEYNGNTNYNMVSSNGATISSGSQESSNNSMTFVSHSINQFQFNQQQNQQQIQQQHQQQHQQNMVQQFQHFNNSHDVGNKSLNGFHTLTAHNLSVANQQQLHQNGLGKKYNSTYHMNGNFNIGHGDVATNGNGNAKPVSDLKKLANFVGRISSENKLNGSSGESGTGSGGEKLKNYKIILNNSTAALNRARSNDPILAMLKAKLKSSS